MAINQVISSNLGPASRSQLYELLQKYNKKEVIMGEWRGVGRKRLLDDSQVNDIEEHPRKENFKSIGRKQLKTMITLMQKEQIEEQGYVPISP
eukprot:11728576-Ditylum_brightwellii.AAC.2